MNLREPFVRKHIHQWAIRGDVVHGSRLIAIRRCEDANCRAQQGVISSELLSYSVSLQPIADVDWVDLSVELTECVRKAAKNNLLPR